MAKVTDLLRQNFQLLNFKSSVFRSTAGGNTQPSVHFCFLGLNARAFELIYTDDQSYPEPVCFMLSIWDS